MKTIERGAVFVMASKEAYTGKPRPAIIIQTDDLDIESILVIPLTTDVGGLRRVRIEIAPDKDNGLKTPSFAMCDKISAIPVSNLRNQVSLVDNDTMIRIEAALTDVLGLPQR